MRRRGLLLAAAPLGAAHAQATPLRIIVTGAVEHAAHDLGQAFTAATGRVVEQAVGNAGSAARRLRAGEAFDLACNSATQVDALIADGVLDPATRTELGRSPLGVGIRKGAALPPIGDAEQLRAMVLAASSLAYSDSSRGATSGVHIDRMLERLGIAEQVKARAQLYAQGIAAAEAVAEGRAGLVITQASEIIAVPGATLVGPLPEDLNLVTTYVGAVTRRAADPAGALALLRFMTGPDGAARFRAAGFRTG